MSDPTISVTMIVKNEEKNLKQGLDSVASIASEFIIVDTGSTDRTREIASEYTDKVYHFDWCDDYGKARNEALKYATCDWVLILNGDETLAPNTPQHILEILTHYSPHDPILILFRLLTPGMSTMYVRGIFSNRLGIHFKGRVHEWPTRPNGPLTSIESPHLIVHHRPHYSSDKYHYDKKLLLLDLKELNAPFERCMHLYHYGRNELKLNSPVGAYDAFQASLKYFYQCQLKRERRLYHNLLVPLARLSLQVGDDLEQAEYFSKELITYFPGFLEGHQLMGYIEFLKGHFTKAQEYYTHTLSNLEQESQTVQVHIGYQVRLGLARIALLQNQYQKGIHELLALYEHTSTPWVALHLARAYCLTKNFVLGRLWIKRSGKEVEQNLIQSLQKLDLWSELEMIQLSQCI